MLGGERSIRAGQGKEVWQTRLLGFGLPRLPIFLFSYVAALELRIEKLERRLAYARSRKASVAQHESDLPAVPEDEPLRKDSLANIRAAIHRKAERKRENSDVNSLMADFGFL